MPPCSFQRQPTVSFHHGERIVDDYAWLQDRDDPAVKRCLETENAYAEEILARNKSLYEELLDEMRDRIPHDDAGVPEERQGYLYYWRVEKGRNHRLFCRRRVASAAQEEVVLDENELAAESVYCRVAALEPSPDQSLLAFLIDTTGEQILTLHVKDLQSGELLGGPIPRVSSIAWAEVRQTLFYAASDELLRPSAIFRLPVESDRLGEAVLVYDESDPAFYLHVEKTSSRVLLLITSSSLDSTEVLSLPAGEPDAPPRIIEPRRPGVQYQIAHQGERLLMVTNRDAKNFRILESEVLSTGERVWRELIPHREDVLIEGVTVLREHLVVQERHDGVLRLRISEADALRGVRYVSFPEPGYSVQVHANQDLDSSRLRFTYSSFLQPDAVVDYDLGTGAWNVRKQPAVPGYDRRQYHAERIVATREDGVRVPVSVVYRKPLQRDRSRPLLLYGYGAYGYSVDPAFDTDRLSLLDRGVIYAFAHVRGGRELGEEWHEQGRLLHKKNSFEDFIACADRLVEQGYTASDRLAIMGASAGGLLVGAVVNMRPALCKAVIAISPFVDVTTALLDPNLPLTLADYAEWGDPADREAFECIRSYSPYDNVATVPYPHMLITAAFNDTAVPYWHSAKWAARLRAMKTGDNLLLLITDMAAGHQGASGRFAQAEENALIDCFLLMALGMEGSAP